MSRILFYFGIYKSFNVLLFSQHSAHILLRKCFAAEDSKNYDRNIENFLKMAHIEFKFLLVKLSKVFWGKQNAEEYFFKKGI